MLLTSLDKKLSSPRKFILVLCNIFFLLWLPIFIIKYENERSKKNFTLS